MKDTDLLRFHDIGQCIQILHPRTAQKSLYPEELRIPVLQKALQMSNLPVSLSLLYRSLKLVKTYDRQEIKQLRRTLTWEEVITLLHVKKDDRKRLQEEAVDEKWPSRELRRQIAEVKDRGHRLSLRQLRSWQADGRKCMSDSGRVRRQSTAMVSRRWALNRPSEDRLKGLQEATDLFEACTRPRETWQVL